MRIGDVTLCWSANREEVPAGFRGKLRIFPAGTAEADLAPFAHRGGRTDPRAHDPRRENREAYVVALATMLVDRDGLDFRTVHQAMLAVEEYATGCAPELLEVRYPHEEY
ncbi:MAG: hypothetical protein WCB10_12060 [Steroidobacteraceae bacterium]